jgi:hypothetical protein
VAQRRHRVVAVRNRTTPPRRNGLLVGCRAVARVRHASLPDGKVPARRRLLANRDRVGVTRQLLEASAPSGVEASRLPTVPVAGVVAGRLISRHGAANRVPRVAVAGTTGVRRAAKVAGTAQVAKAVRAEKAVKVVKAAVARQGVSLGAGRRRTATADPTLG